MNRQQPLEALAAASAANVDAMRSLAFASIKATERLMSLNLDFARTSLRLGADCARPASSADWRHMLSQQNGGLQKSAEEAAAYLRNVYDVSAEAQAEVNEVISSRVGDLSGSMNSLLEAMAQSAPGGSGKAMDMIKSAFANGCSAYVQLVRNSQQVAANAAQSSRKSRRA